MDENYKPSNREKVLAPRKPKKGWCGGCDRCLVGHWRKCPICGHRNGRGRLLK